MQVAALEALPSRTVVPVFPRRREHEERNETTYRRVRLFWAGSFRGLVVLNQDAETTLRSLVRRAGLFDIQKQGDASIFPGT